MKREVYLGLGLKDEEYKKIKKLLGREPNYLELSMFSVLWSEHCAYKHSREVLKKLPTKASWVIQGPGENAGVVDIGDGLAVAFKIESHNHPSAIEPFQGAATGVGGIVRDIFSMGARPIALLDPLRFGELNEERVRYLFEEVVAGIASYGNCIGVPTVGGDLYFESAYRGNPLVNVMCVGLVKKENLLRGIARGVGNLILLIGARTGRDGIHGATFASGELTEESEERRPSVQIGDPFTEKLLIEACLELSEKELLVALQDLGAAGLTSSSAEMASKGGVGVDIDVSKVPRREEGMEPYEVMISESQERMLAIVKPENLEEAISVCKRWGVGASVIGKVTGTSLLRVFDGKKLVGEIPVEALTKKVPVYHPQAKKPSYLQKNFHFDLNSLPTPSSFNEVLMKLVSSPNLCSRKWVYEQYDHMVQTNTVVLPGSDAAVLRVKGTRKGIALTVDGNGRYTYLNPRVGGRIAVAEALRNLVVSGAKPLAITDCLNFGNPEDPEIFWQFKEAVEGMSEACRELGVPVVSGNVSFYNESFGEAIYPTPIVGAVGLIEDTRNHLTIAFKEKGSLIVLIGETFPDLGGSEYLKLMTGKVAGEPPKIDFEREKKLYEFILEASAEGILLSAHDLSEGGLAQALVESSLAKGYGVHLDVEEPDDWAVFLFSESQSRAIVTLRGEDLPRLKMIAFEKEVPFTLLGHVSGRMFKVNDRIEIVLDDLRKAWENSLFSNTF
jgi:phosphoribosylformylglycinamidine synthase